MSYLNMWVHKCYPDGYEDLNDAFQIKRTAACHMYLHMPLSLPFAPGDFNYGNPNTAGRYLGGTVTPPYTRTPVLWPSADPYMLVTAQAFSSMSPSVTLPDLRSVAYVNDGGHWPYAYEQFRATGDNKAECFVEQARIHELDLATMESRPIYTRTYRPGFADEGKPRRSIVSVHPLVEPSGECSLYVYSRSIQIQEGACKALFDAAEMVCNNGTQEDCPGCDGRTDNERTCNPKPDEKDDIFGYGDQWGKTVGTRKCYKAERTVGGNVNGDIAAQNFNGFKVDDPSWVQSCCVEVHHHVEKMACDTPDSHLASRVSPQNDYSELLKFEGGGENGTLYKSMAFKGKFGWAEHMSPKMGIAIDQDYIYVLSSDSSDGAVEGSSVKQYERVADGSAPLKLVNTYMHRLCLPNCKLCSTQKLWNGNAPRAGTRHTNGAVNDDKKGKRRWAGHLDFEAGLSLMNNDGGQGSDFEREITMDVNAGGALTLDLGDDGVATRVYGISHCGTVFMIEPAHNRSMVLQHMPSWSSTSRWEVGITLQTYQTPVARVSRLFIVLSDPHTDRYINVRRYGNIHPKGRGGPGSRMADGTLYRLDVNKAITGCSRAKYHSSFNPDLNGGWGKYEASPTWNIGDITVDTSGGLVMDQTWTGDLPLRETAWPHGLPLTSDGTFLSDCSAALTTLETFQGVSTMHYSHGSLRWWSNFQVSIKPLDIVLPCSTVKPLLEKLTDRWCTGEENCQTHYPGGLQLDEGGEKPAPWDLYVFKKNNPGSWSKTVVCSRPTRPTTRHSPEACCSWKSLETNNTAVAALL